MYSADILSMFIIIIFILTAQAMPEYTKYRNPDAKAICDLAMYNYTEVSRCLVFALNRMGLVLLRIYYIHMQEFVITLI